MKKSLLAMLSLLLIAAFLVGGCDKKSSTSPNDQKPTIPVFNWSVPGVDTSACSQQAYGYVTNAAVMTQLTNAFAALPGQNNNGTWTWQVTESGVTYTLTGTLGSNSQYTWTLKANGTETGTSTTYTNFTLMTGTSAQDGSSGDLTIYDDSSPSTPKITAKFSWTIPSANTVNANVDVYNSGSPYARATITSTAGGGGSVYVYPWTGSAYGTTAIYHGSWSAPNGAVTCS